MSRMCPKSSFSNLHTVSVAAHFAWLVRNHRLAKDWEGPPATSEAWIYLAMSRLMTKK
jgi:hypothetical protein